MSEAPWTGVGGFFVYPRCGTTPTRRRVAALAFAKRFGGAGSIPAHWSARLPAQASERYLTCPASGRIHTGVKLDSSFNEEGILWVFMSMFLR